MNKRLISYGVVLIALMMEACEDIYTADLEKRENVIVVDARLLSGKENNVVTLKMSLGFNAINAPYASVKGAGVTIVDNNGNELELTESNDGVFEMNSSIDQNLDYKLKIDYKGDTYTSEFESVQKVPTLDSIYGIPEIKLTEITGENDNDFRQVEGIQIYGDIGDNKESPYYRFTAKKVLQYTYPFPPGDFFDIMYAWSTHIPDGTFNIASPQEYTNQTKIIKHPLFFLEKEGYVEGDQSFQGWILVLYQFGLSKSSHRYYKDLNSQLESDGKLFDPLYVQARSNLKCITDQEKIVLGNFEISTVNEYRVFVKFFSDEKGYIVKPIPYFYEIPWEGEKTSTPPDFWEWAGKTYPDE